MKLSIRKNYIWPGTVFIGSGNKCIGICIEHGYGTAYFDTHRRGTRGYELYIDPINGSIRGYDFNI